MNNNNDHEEDRQKLRELQAVFEKAVKENTIDDIQPFIDEQFSYVSFTDKSFSDFESFRKQWSITRDKMIGQGEFTTQLNPNKSIFVGDVALCSGNATNQMNVSDSVKYEFSSNWTVVFRRSEKGWKILRAHNSLDPFANPMLVSGVKKKIAKFSALSFFFGGVLCAILTYILVR